MARVVLQFKYTRQGRQFTGKAVASAVMAIDVEEPTHEEISTGARDPMGFYTQYGFTPFPKSARRLFKRVTTIEKELNL